MYYSDSFYKFNENNRIRKYNRNINKLITKCKNSEKEINKINLNKTMKRQFDKTMCNVKWAVGEYLEGISGNDWKRTKSIDLMLRIKKFTKESKKEIYTPEFLDRMKFDMTKRALAISAFGKRKIWKPPRYIPSRQIVIANSMDELNNLYRIN